MDAGTTGAKASTSRRDRTAVVRRARLVQALFLQAGLALMLVVLAAFSWRDPQALALFLATLVVPIGWSYAFWRAHGRENAARADGTWSKDWDARERRRTLALLGSLLAGWLAVAASIVLLL